MTHNQHKTKWKLTIRVGALVTFLVVMKILFHTFDLEVLELNSLFGAIISANVFLLGFLISGVLVDYKEAEKIPGDLAVALESIHDDVPSIVGKKYVAELGNMMIQWFHRSVRTTNLKEKVGGLNKFLDVYNKNVPAALIVRLKNEQTNIRRLITRAHTIRETGFNPSGYAVAEVITSLMSVALVLTVIEPFWESIFLIVVVSFILIYMILLIGDFDNPFSYNDQSSLSGEVSLKPLEDLDKVWRKG